MEHKEDVKVSVVICFYNEERFLPEAVQSVFDQSFKNWELILVDDGSSDSSSSFAKNLAFQDPARVIYIEHPEHGNRGLSASRNEGIAKARGEYVAFLDADDIWLPVKLENQVAIMNLHPQAGMLCEASEYWYSWQKNLRSDIVVPVGSQQDHLFSPSELSTILYPLSTGSAPCPSGLILRKSVLDKHNGFEAHFTGKYQMYEDQAFLQKIYLNEYVYVSSACNNRYRQREGSLVQKVKAEGKYHEVRKFFLEWLADYLKRNSVANREVENLLHYCLQQYRNPLVFNIRKIVKKAIGSVNQKL